MLDSRKKNQDTSNIINTGGGISIDQSETWELNSIMECWRHRRPLSVVPQVPIKQLLLWQLLTFISITLYRWVQVHSLKKSSSYYIDIWIENIAVVCFLYLFLQRYLFQKHHAGKMFYYLKFTIALHIILTVIESVDFLAFTRKSSGTEFYQFTLALSPLILLVLLHKFYIFEISVYFNYAIGLLTCWKLMILFQDIEFNLSFSTSAFGLFVAICYGLYWLMLCEKIKGASTLEIVFMMSVSRVMMLPLLVVTHYYQPSSKNLVSGLTIAGLSKILLMAILKIASFSSTLILLKKSDPITAVLTVNLAYIPDNFIQALIYKLDCTLSATKVNIIITVEFFIGTIKNVFGSDGVVLPSN